MYSDLPTFFAPNGLKKVSVQAFYGIEGRRGRKTNNQTRRKERKG